MEYITELTEDQEVQLAAQAFKIEGWSEEEGTSYWILETNFGKDWGENGMLRMKKGTNEFGIEEGIIGLSFSQTDSKADLP